jgi:hypothetical protein
MDQGGRGQDSNNQLELSLGDGFDAVVHYGETTVELKAGGAAVVKTRGDVDAYTNGTAPAKAVLRIGERMPDGTIYAGTAPDTGDAFYTMPEDAPLTYSFNQAAAYAEILNRQKFLGHDDWRVPTKDELHVLFRNRAAIGGFNETGSHSAGWYWSSTEDSLNFAWDQRFSDGHRGWHNEDDFSSLRCVRG